MTWPIHHLRNLTPPNGLAFTVQTTMDAHAFAHALGVGFASKPPITVLLRVTHTIGSPFPCIGFGWNGAGRWTCKTPEDLQAVLNSVLGIPEVRAVLDGLESQV